MVDPPPPNHAVGPPPLGDILDRFRREPSRLWSLVVTFYGDAILPRGGSVWLGTLTRFVTALGVSEGALRTAMSRLAGDGWLERSRVGRNSFYRLAPKGRATFLPAAGHIYHPPRLPWSGRFDLAILAGDADREAAGAALQDASFGSPLPGLWLAPEGAPMPNNPGIAYRLTAAADPETGRRLAASAWPLERTAEGYRRFVEGFGPIGARLAGGLILSDLDGLILRILLIHDYRRIILRDPVLPPALLPEDWPGAEARRLCGQIYHAVLDASERWLDQNGICEDGRLPPADPAIHRRFR